MSLPTSSGGGGPPGGSARLATAARRLVRPSQMDFECVRGEGREGERAARGAPAPFLFSTRAPLFLSHAPAPRPPPSLTASPLHPRYTAWFAVQLLTAPKTAYRHVAYHRQTKLQWARDDPAFALALAALTAGVGAAHGVGAGGGLGGGLRGAVRALVLDFGLISALAATAGWAAAAAVGSSSSGGGEGGGGGGPPGAPATPPAGVEWLYALDIHCNAALPALLEVGAAGFVLSPWLLRPGTGPALAAAALWAGAALHYSYLTTLGYSAVGPTAARAPEAALYPGMVAAVVLPLAAVGGGWNVARFGVGLLFGGGGRRG